MDDTSSNISIVRENLRKLIVPLIRQILQDKPLDYLTYCTNYFQNLFDENKSNDENPTRESSQSNRNKDGENESVQVEPAIKPQLQGSASLPILTDELNGVVRLRETSSWNQPSDMKKLQPKRRSIICNKADVTGHMGDYQNNELQENEEAIVVGKNEAIPRKRFEKTYEGDEDLIPFATLSEKTSGVSMSPENNLNNLDLATAELTLSEDIDSYLCKLIDTFSSLNLTNIASSEPKCSKEFEQKPWRPNFESKSKFSEESSSDSDDLEDGSEDVGVYIPLDDKDVSTDKNTRCCGNSYSSKRPFLNEMNKYHQKNQQDRNATSVSMNNRLNLDTIVCMLKNVSKGLKELIEDMRVIEFYIGGNIRMDLRDSYNNRHIEREKNMEAKNLPRENLFNSTIDNCASQAETTKKDSFTSDGKSIFIAENKQYFKKASCQEEIMKKRRRKTKSEKNKKRMSCKSEGVKSETNVGIIPEFLTSNVTNHYSSLMSNATSNYFSNCNETDFSVNRRMHPNVANQRPGYNSQSFRFNHDFQQFARPPVNSRHTPIMPTHYVRPFVNVREPYPGMVMFRPATALSQFGEQGDVPPHSYRWSIDTGIETSRTPVTNSNCTRYSMHSASDFERQSHEPSNKYECSEVVRDNEEEKNSEIKICPTSCEGTRDSENFSPKSEKTKCVRFAPHNMNCVTKSKVSTVNSDLNLYSNFNLNNSPHAFEDNFEETGVHNSTLNLKENTSSPCQELASNSEEHLKDNESLKADIDAFEVQNDNFSVEFVTNGGTSWDEKNEQVQEDQTDSTDTKNQFEIVSNGEKSEPLKEPVAGGTGSNHVVDFKINHSKMSLNSLVSKENCGTVSESSHDDVLHISETNMADGDQGLKEGIISVINAKQNIEPGLTSAGGDFVNTIMNSHNSTQTGDENGRTSTQDNLSSGSSSNTREISKSFVENAVREALEAQSKIREEDFDYYFPTDSSDSHSSDLSEENFSEENNDL